MWTYCISLQELCQVNAMHTEKQLAEARETLLVLLLLHQCNAMQCTHQKPAVHASIHAFIHACMHAYIHSFIHSFIHFFLGRWANHDN